MKRTAFFAVALLCVMSMPMGTASAATEKKIKPAMELSHTGEIRGVIDYCGSGDILVYIPGKSFIAKTGPSGEFVLYYVPPATYNLTVEVEDQAPFTIPDVIVEKKMITDLGTLSLCPDSDADGFDASLDCNDNNPAIYPGAGEVCDDGLDNDCDGSVDEGCTTCTDADSDGFYAQEGCGTPVDCNDSELTINPAASEICGDNLDNNCNGVLEEGCPTDNDADGYDSSVDCNDSNASVNPGAEEVCDDGIDNDCDGAMDQDDSDCNTGVPTCAEAINLGSISGDSGCVSGPTVSAGTGQKWYRIRVREDSGDIFGASLRLTVTLQVMSGDYDLYVYWNCGALRCSSTNSGTATEQLILEQDDEIGADDSFDVWIEVRDYSGTPSSTWNLVIQGDCGTSLPDCP